MFNIKVEAYRLATVWAEYVDRRSLGQVAYITNSLEVNQHSSESPDPEPWEFAPEDLGEFLVKASRILQPRVFEVETLQKALEEAKDRIGLRNKQIRDLRRALRNQS